MPVVKNDFIDWLRLKLKNREVNFIENNKGYKESAVLIPIIERRGNLNIIFTQRTNDLPHHKGQISFPGGKVEKRDKDFVDTVLRETEEEIGIKRDFVDILGRLDDELTLVSNFIIHPFVGFLNNVVDFKINKREVQTIIEVPLEFFLDIGDDPQHYDIPYENSIINTKAYKYGDNLIWGATCRIMTKFIRIIKEHDEPL
mgnify:CR=1 FL=1